MSNAEHLIENVIFAMKRGEDPKEELKRGWNPAMLADSWVKPEELIAMADHVVYGLYEGRFPEGGE